MNNRKHTFKITLAIIFLFTFFGLNKAQEEDSTYRKVTSRDEFNNKEKGTIYKSGIVRKRPSRAKQDKKVLTATVKIKPKINASVQSNDADWEELGFTLWKLRKKINGETNVSLQIWEDGVKVEYVPERVKSNTILSKGDKIRITIESPREGYLYIFDRENFTDGTYGKPILIFPTRKIRDGNNRVKAGILTDIPAQEDDSPIFIIDSDNPYYDGEIISVLIADKPIGEIQTPDKAVDFDSSVFESWWRKWGLTTEIYEMEGGEGTVWTSAEKDAGSKNKGRSLTQSDPPPQTVYRFQTKPNTPIMVSFALKIRKST